MWLGLVRVYVLRTVYVFKEVLIRGNPTHYGDPAGSSSCMTDEEAIQITGITGDFCSPQCDASGACPTDLPKGVTAKPSCALQTSTGEAYCALICDPTDTNADTCGKATCKSIQGTGLCTYDD